MTLVSVIGPFGEVKEKGAEFDRLLKIPFLCSFSGNETDLAFIKAAKERALNDEGVKKVSEIPFDSKNKYSSATVKISGDTVQIFKGAPDIILSFCSYYNNGSEIIKLTKEDRARIEGYIEAFASRGQRLLSAATRTENISSLPSGLVFEGIYGFIDPPRDEAKDAVLKARRAGIRPVMITGDHILTAKAIATELGIFKEGDRIISGSELNTMTDKQLKEAVKTATVFARVSPEHKVRIVKGFKSRGHIVAMTGDGVNDAPALKEADIGTAMGKKGTDVAKSASDIVLLDDNFASIVKGIREGRGIFENIRKAVHFLLSSNIGEIFTIFAAFVLKLPTPLLPIQLLWINLITDSLPALALGADKIDDDIMNRKPKSPKEGIINTKLGLRMFSEGILIGILAVASFIFSLRFTSSLPAARTSCFLTLCLSQLIHSFNVKTEKSIFRKETLQNKYHVASFFVCCFFALLIVNVPLFANLFSLCPLSGGHLLITILVSFIPVIYDEIIKRLA
jgi:Ca2+-transporting ATPase